MQHIEVPAEWSPHPDIELFDLRHYDVNIIPVRGRDLREVQSSIGISPLRDEAHRSFSIGVGIVVQLQEPMFTETATRLPRPTLLPVLK